MRRRGKAAGRCETRKSKPPSKAARTVAKAEFLDYIDDIAIDPIPKKRRITMTIVGGRVVYDREASP